jgi:hypothetical protein
MNPRNQVIWIIGILALAGPAHAGDKAAREILDRAIKAHGGEKAMTRAAQLRRRDTGSLVTFNGTIKFSSEVVRSLPDRLRLSVDTGKIKVISVLNGNKGWSTDGGPAVELLPARVQELREEAYVQWAATLVPLTKTGFTLTTLPKTRVGGDSALGIKVVRKGYPELRLYFLERSGLLARIEREAREAGLKVDKEYLYSGYKVFDGVKLPTSHTELINGKKFTEFTSSDVSFPARIDEKTFAKP